MHVLVPDNVDPVVQVILGNHNALRVTAPGKMSRDETMATIETANALIIRSSTKADAELLAAAPNLKAIARAGVGVDNIDLDAATEHGVVVMNTPHGNTIATAEHAFGLMLALARDIPQAHISLAEGRWDRKKYMGTELRGKTLGIIGLGRIGRAIAARAQAFEMDCITYDPFVDAEVSAHFNVESVEMRDLYARADFITLHALVTDETEGMINEKAISQMKPGVRIINAARGALINDADLAAALKSGHVGGAALDVYAVEPPAAENPLIGLPNVIHTPHLAASTHEAQVAVAAEAAELIVDALLKEEYHNVVNRAVLNR